MSRSRTWTTAALGRERTEFFDTRVTGRPEVWQTLHAALEELWQSDIATHQVETASTTAGEEDDDDEEHRRQPSVALATAQSILDAADVTLPTGDLAQGAYDALGNYYPLPEWIVADPVNVGQDAAAAAAAGYTKSPSLAASQDDLAEAEAEAERRREEKGKAVADLENQIEVRARLSENSHDVVITLGKDETVRSLARRISEEAQVGYRLYVSVSSEISADKKMARYRAPPESASATWARSSKRARRWWPRAGRKATW